MATRKTPPPATLALVAGGSALTTGFAMNLANHNISKLAKLQWVIPGTMFVISTITAVASKNPGVQAAGFATMGASSALLTQAIVEGIQSGEASTQGQGIVARRMRRKKLGIKGRRRKRGVIGTFADNMKAGKGGSQRPPETRDIRPEVMATFKDRMRGGGRGVAPFTGGQKRHPVVSMIPSKLRPDSAVQSYEHCMDDPYDSDSLD